MTLYEFNLLDYEDKISATWNHGIHLDNYITEIERCALYGIDKFFVEVVFMNNQNDILELRSFKTGSDLEKYLPKISTKL